MQPLHGLRIARRLRALRKNAGGRRESADGAPPAKRAVALAKAHLGLDHDLQPRRERASREDAARAGDADRGVVGHRVHVQLPHDVLQREHRRARPLDGRLSYPTDEERTPNSIVRIRASTAPPQALATRTSNRASISTGSHRRCSRAIPLVLMNMRSTTNALGTSGARARHANQAQLSSSALANPSAARSPYGQSAGPGPGESRESRQPISHAPPCRRATTRPAPCRLFAATGWRRTLKEGAPRENAAPAKP